MISAAELALLQTAANKVLDTTCTVQRNSNLGGASDAFGTVADNWANVSGLVNVAAERSQPSGSYMQKLAEQLGDLSLWVVTLPAGSAVKVGDRILIDGLTLTVAHLLLPESYQIFTQVLASTVRPG